MYRGILLDFYGTMVHEDDEVIQGICLQIQETSPQRPTLEDIAAAWWTCFSGMCSRAYLDRFHSQRELALQSLQETLELFASPLNPDLLINLQFDRWVTSPLFEDTQPFLEKISIPVCIVSNIDRMDIQAAMEYHGLQTEYLVTSDDARAYKPRTEMFELALKTMGLSRSEVLHVGDSRTSDIQGAKNAGMAVAWINRAAKPGSHVAEPDYEITSLAEVLDIVAVANGCG
ncbi:MAG: HAD family hydrolase [Thermomicrobiales bacterium]|nr:HAD family hydrolase [Thermomicrobiales bacterium]